MFLDRLPRCTLFMLLMVAEAAMQLPLVRAISEATQGADENNPLIIRPRHLRSSLGEKVVDHGQNSSSSANQRRLLSLNVLLDFEGIQDGWSVGEFYNGQAVNGTIGPQYKVSFSPNTKAKKWNNTAPSPSTIVLWPSIPSAPWTPNTTINVGFGFEDRVAFSYVNLGGEPVKYYIFRELDGKGDVLASGSFWPSGSYGDWTRLEIPFEGIASSVVLTDVEDNIGIDDLVFGDRAPVTVCRNKLFAVCRDCQASPTEAELIEAISPGTFDPDKDPLDFRLQSTGPFGFRTSTEVIMDVYGRKDFHFTCNATVIVDNHVNLPIDFEGLPDVSLVDGYYNGVGGPAYGVSFSNFLVAKTKENGGATPIYKPPSGVNVATTKSSTTGIINVASGFKNRLSLTYIMGTNASYSIFDGLNGAGNVLASGTFYTYFPSSSFSLTDPVWTRANVTFGGIAKSVTISGIGFYDDIMIGNRPPALKCRDKSFVVCPNCQLSITKDEMIQAIKIGSHDDPDGDDVILSVIGLLGTFDIGTSTPITLIAQDRYFGESRCSSVILVYDHVRAILDFNDFGGNEWGPVGDYYNRPNGSDVGVVFPVAAYITTNSSLEFIHRRGNYTKWIDVPAGFDTRLSLLYRSIDHDPEPTYAIYDGLSGTGKLLANGTLYNATDPDPSSRSQWKRLEVSFNGVAMSIVFYEIFWGLEIDDLTIGNRAPVARCKNKLFRVCPNCQASPTMDDMILGIDGGSFDPDKDKLTFSFNNAGPFDFGTSNDVLMTVSDGYGGTSMCGAIVTVVLGLGQILDFEGIGDNKAVGDFYNGVGGPDYDVSFSLNAKTITSKEIGGTGDFTFVPSGSTALYWPSGSGSMASGVINVFNKGFHTRLSFFYNSVSVVKYSIYENEDGAGELLASGVLLPVDRSMWGLSNATFDGVAQSIVLEGVTDNLIIDDLVLGNRAPIVNCNNAKFTSYESQVTPTYWDMIRQIQSSYTDLDRDSLDFTFDTIGPFDAGTSTIVTMTADDGFGGKSSCKATVTVERPASAATMSFEGLGSGTKVGEYYNGMGGPAYAVSFDPVATVTFWGEKDPAHQFVIGWPSSDQGTSSSTESGIINFVAGIETKLSLYYFSASPATYEVYDGIDGSGTLLTSGTFPTVGTDNGDANTLQQMIVTFSGVAKSLVLGQVVGNLVIDDLVAGNSLPNAKCKNATVVVGSDCKASLSTSDLVTLVDDGSADQDNDGLTFGFDKVGPFGVGSLNLNMTIEDEFGGKAWCTATVVVENKDADGDGICDYMDNCPTVANPGQEDDDKDKIGNACDACTDVDRDGVCNGTDKCANTASGALVFVSGTWAGCSIADRCPCGTCTGKKNGNAAYKTCIIGVVNDMAKAGLINSAMKKSLTSNLSATCCL